MDLQSVAQQLFRVRQMATDSRTRLTALAQHLGAISKALQKELAVLENTKKKETLVGHTADTMVGRPLPKSPPNHSES